MEKPTDVIEAGVVGPKVEIHFFPCSPRSRHAIFCGRVPHSIEDSTVDCS